MFIVTLVHGVQALGPILNPEFYAIKFLLGVVR